MKTSIMILMKLKIAYCMRLGDSLYRKHKIAIGVVAIVIIILEFWLKVDYFEVADHSISVIAIALGIYIAALTALLGSKTMTAMKNAPDPNVPGKSKLGVLITYFRAAMLCGLVSIVISYISIFNKTNGWFSNYLHSEIVLSSLGFALLSLNFLFMWLLFSFIVNSIILEA